MTKKIAVVLATAVLAQSFATSLAAADLNRTYVAPDSSDGVRIGVLACNIGGGIGYLIGSAKTLECVFTPAGGGTPDYYSGAVRKLGVDVGFTTRGGLVWAVFAPTAGYHRGSLGGLYQGITAEATLAGGVGANILIGGTSGSIHLQTISVTGQLGLNVAATGTSVTLTPAG
ncbi:hypothetical protein A6U87_05190 [Rhizobium sp. AC44/96]|jgi:hypothetical protein|uniref:DUF992 domain-containing protein n=1 Tax=unclassified Rhizobium TaxID=2613769 RepID=UPI00080FFDAA|nr:MULTISPECIES: DUF992 domain-containing protein [unclassified Rhizobium]MDM9619824.1 DUF992 domain-containing protein [Rhizobium sp. S96]OCJ18289.1 hypothetical protein A6U87_05190 [Rhizobium sp. AC44/96]